MKASKVYHFLGSVYFALLLITLTTVFVIAGTFIESATQSHRYASQFTYSSPIFVVILWGFFINILVSALRRWPFKVKHIPFLITHMGLLMILGGVLIKVNFGVQGTMSVMEGAGSHRISKDNTFAIQIEKRGELPLNTLLNDLYTSQSSHHGLSLEILKYSPNSSEKLATWIKGDVAVIKGHNPFTAMDYPSEADMDEIILSGKAKLHDQHSTEWEMYALRTNDINKAIIKLYQQGALLKISHRISGSTLATLDLAQSLKEPISLNLKKFGNFGLAKASLNLNVFSINELGNEPNFQIEAINNSWKIQVPLNGDSALLNENQSTPHIGSSPLAIDIIRTPVLALIEDQFNDVSLVAFDAHGQIWTKSFANNSLHSYLAYDEGFGGYAVQCDLPFPDILKGRDHRETLMHIYLASQLQQAISSEAPLAPPLQLLQQACQQANVDFLDTLLAFLIRWNNQHSWLYSDETEFPEQLNTVFKQINWQRHPQAACFWTVRLFDQIGSSIYNGSELLKTLRNMNWPLIVDCEKIYKEHAEKDSIATGKLLSLLTQQIFSTDDQLGADIAIEQLSGEGLQQARFLSAYFRAYDIHISNIMPNLTQLEMRQLAQQKQDSQKTPLIPIETSLIAMLEETPNRKKLEDNIPAVTLLAQENGQRQTIQLAYDRFASGLKWPILNGSYLLRFQPQFLEIPYHIRLRHARQINYANSRQAFSYESDIIVTDRRTGESVEKTISMNHVHETADGYRFYLSNITPSDETSVKRIQIVVNRDPAKYWLTYPGALILSLGIILLFWMRPYKIRPNKNNL